MGYSDTNYIQQQRHDPQSKKYHGCPDACYHHIDSFTIRLSVGCAAWCLYRIEPCQNYFLCIHQPTYFEFPAPPTHGHAAKRLRHMMTAATIYAYVKSDDSGPISIPLPYLSIKDGATKTPCHKSTLPFIANERKQGCRSSNSAERQARALARSGRQDRIVLPLRIPVNPHIPVLLHVRPTTQSPKLFQKERSW